jgi:hypothetical protein
MLQKRFSFLMMITLGISIVSTPVMAVVVPTKPDNPQAQTAPDDWSSDSERNSITDSERAVRNERQRRSEEYARHQGDVTMGMLGSTSDRDGKFQGTDENFRTDAPSSSSEPAREAAPAAPQEEPPQY